MTYVTDGYDKNPSSGFDGSVGSLSLANGYFIIGNGSGVGAANSAAQALTALSLTGLSTSGNVATMSGVTAPRFSLNVGGVAERAYFEYDNATSYARVDSDGYLILAGNNTAGLTVNNSGYVAVNPGNILNAATPLHVRSTATYQLRLDYNASVYNQWHCAGDGFLDLYSNATKILRFGYNYHQFLSQILVQPVANNSYALDVRNASGNNRGGIFVQSDGRSGLYLQSAAGGTTHQIDGSSTPYHYFYDRNATAGAAVSMATRFFRASDSHEMGYSGFSGSLDFLLYAYRGRVIIASGVTSGASNILLNPAGGNGLDLSTTVATFYLPVAVTGNASSRKVSANNNWLERWLNSAGDLRGGSYVNSAGGLEFYVTNSSGSNILDVRADGIRQACPATQLADGSLSAATLHFSVDESGHNLQIKIKYSDGTTVKTAAVALT